MVIDSTEALLKLLDRVTEALRVSTLLKGHDQTLVVAYSCHDFLPFLDQRSCSAIGSIVRQGELSALAPDSQLVDGLTDCHFTLGLVAQVFDVLLLLNHMGNCIDEVAELHVVESDLFWHAKNGNETTPVLLLKGLTCAKLHNRPCLLVVLDQAEKEACHDSLVLGSFELVGPLQEEVLECKVVFLAVGEPLFFAHLIDLLLEGLEHTPRFVLHLKLVLHLVVVSKGGLLFAEVLTVLSSLLDTHLQVVPLLAELLHHL